MALTLGRDSENSVGVWGLGVLRRWVAYGHFEITMALPISIYGIIVRSQTSLQLLPALIDRVLSL